MFYFTNIVFFNPHKNWGSQSLNNKTKVMWPIHGSSDPKLRLQRLFFLTPHGGFPKKEVFQGNKVLPGLMTVPESPGGEPGEFSLKSLGEEVVLRDAITYFSKKESQPGTKPGSRVNHSTVIRMKKNPVTISG